MRKEKKNGRNCFLDGKRCLRSTRDLKESWICHTEETTRFYHIGVSICSSVRPCHRSLAGRRRALACFVAVLSNGCTMQVQEPSQNHHASWCNLSKIQFRSLNFLCCVVPVHRLLLCLNTVRVSNYPITGLARVRHLWIEAENPLVFILHSNISLFRWRTVVWMLK